MRRIRLRVALPLLHTLIDLLFLSACIRLAYVDSREAKDPVVWRQHYSHDHSATFEYYTPQPLGAISAGTLPISLVTTLAFPTWLASQPFDLRWVSLHLVLGIAFWYIVGRLCEARRAWRIGLV